MMPLTLPGGLETRPTFLRSFSHPHTPDSLQTCKAWQSKECNRWDKQISCATQSSSPY